MTGQLPASQLFTFFSLSLSILFVRLERELKEMRMHVIFVLDKIIITLAL